MDQETGCPEDYAELFDAYFPMMVGVVSRSGIQALDVEDVAMDILARFIEKDGISYYDPERLHDVGESPDLPGARYRKAKFKGMLRGFTATYVMQYRDKQMIRHRREPWRLEKPVGYEHSSREVTWLEATMGETTVEPTLDSEVSLCIVQALQKARESLINKGKRDYCAFIDLCVQHGLLDGKLDRRAIAVALGVSTSTVTAMLKDLREILRPLLSEAGVMSGAA